VVGVWLSKLYDCQRWKDMWVADLTTCGVGRPAIKIYRCSASAYRYCMHMHIILRVCSRICITCSGCVTTCVKTADDIGAIFHTNEAATPSKYFNYHYSLEMPFDYQYDQAAVAPYYFRVGCFVASGMIYTWLEASVGWLLVTIDIHVDLNDSIAIGLPDRLGEGACKRSIWCYRVEGDDERGRGGGGFS